jgi:hypothetical protein
VSHTWRAYPNFCNSRTTFRTPDRRTVAHKVHKVFWGLQEITLLLPPVLQGVFLSGRHHSYGNPGWPCLGNGRDSAVGLLERFVLWIEPDSSLIFIFIPGMALELLHPSNPHLALDSYRTVLPFFASLQSELGLNVVPPSSHSVASDSLSTPSTLSSAPSSHPASQNYHYPHLYPSVIQLPMLAQAGGKPDLSLFVPLKELWRWVERLLWRAVVLTAQVCDIRIDDVPPSTSANDSQTGTSAHVSRQMIRDDDSLLSQCMTLCWLAFLWLWHISFIERLILPILHILLALDLILSLEIF